MGTNTVPLKGSPPLTTVEINTTSTTTIVAPASIHPAGLYRLSLTITGTTTLEFTGAAAMRRYDFNNGGTIALDYSGYPWYQALSGSALIMTQTSTAQLSGEIDYAYADQP